MKVVGIIAEYNPIHNGHIYHLNKSKEITNSDFVIVIMSGNFTQAGNIAIYDKFKRAKIATNIGADLVIELPTIYATSSANYFSFGAINILDKLNIVDNICFGSECNNISNLNYISDIITKNENELWNNINKNLKSGISFASAREQALLKYLSDEQISILKSPNDILGLEYINAIKSLNSHIKANIIKRNSSNFNEITINKNSTIYTSSTSIRKYIKDKKFNEIKSYIPDITYDLVNNSYATFNDDLFNIIKYKIISNDIANIQNIAEVTEGLENKIIKEINNSKNYEELIYNIKSKRYQLSKIKRMLINLLLDIKKDDIEYAIRQKIAYAHVLSCSTEGKKLLSQISKNSDINLITSLNKNIQDNLPEDIKRYLKFDILASDIYSIINNDAIKKDYTNKL